MDSIFKIYNALRNKPMTSINSPYESKMLAMEGQLRGLTNQEIRSVNGGSLDDIARASAYASSYDSVTFLTYKPDSRNQDAVVARKLAEYLRVNTDSPTARYDFLGL